jgi:WhiB family redox-sensing transcriptional regulator
MDDGECLYLVRTGQMTQKQAYEVFFPTLRSDNGKRAKAICVICPVKEQCLEYAMNVSNIPGVWGGRSEKERRRLRRERRAVARDGNIDS